MRRHCRNCGGQADLMTSLILTLKGSDWAWCDKCGRCGQFDFTARRW